MKKLALCLLTLFMLTTTAGSVFADTNTQTVSSDNGSVTANISYTATNTGDVDTIKSAIYVTVESTITPGSVNVNHTYSANDGKWTEAKSVTDKQAGSAKFKVTNYSYNKVKALIEFAPESGIAKDVDDVTLEIGTNFAYTYGDTTWDVPTEGVSVESDLFTIAFDDDLSVANAEAALETSKKMGTFTITINGNGGPEVEIQSFNIYNSNDSSLAGSYSYEEDMTWAAWLASDYNTNDRYVSDGNYVLDPDNNMHIASDSTKVLITDQITGDSYSLVSVDETPETSTFTISGIEYEYEEGQTWAEWIASDYNDGLDISSNLTNYVKGKIAITSKLKLNDNCMRYMMDQSPVVAAATGSNDSLMGGDGVWVIEGSTTDLYEACDIAVAASATIDASKTYNFYCYDD